MEYILLRTQKFILLIKGADFFVEGSSSLAGILKVPSSDRPARRRFRMPHWLAVMISPSVRRRLEYL